MIPDDSNIQMIEQYLETRCRIYAVERKALEKRGIPKVSGPICSFCGRPTQGPNALIQGLNEARICSECAATLNALLSNSGPNEASHEF
jgi:hypothetical protein